MTSLTKSPGGELELLTNAYLDGCNDTLRKGDEMMIYFFIVIT